MKDVTLLETIADATSVRVTQVGAFNPRRRSGTKPMFATSDLAALARLARAGAMTREVQSAAFGSPARRGAGPEGSSRRGWRRGYARDFPVPWRLHGSERYRDGSHRPLAIALKHITVKSGEDDTLPAKQQEHRTMGAAP